MKRMQDLLQHHDFSKFNPMKERLLQQVDNMLATDIGKSHSEAPHFCLSLIQNALFVARLMAQIPKEDDVKSDLPAVRGGAFNGVDQSPFAFGSGEGVDAGRGEPEWVVNKERYKWDESFHSLSPVDGKVTGELRLRFTLCLCPCPCPNADFHARSSTLTPILF